MGYYTNFYLSVEPEQETVIEYLKTAIKQDPNKTDLEELILDILEGNADACKWYPYKEDMCEFSKKFPEHTFLLEGNGEEWDDWWKCYFRKGKYQQLNGNVTIVYPEFSEQNWKELE